LASLCYASLASPKYGTFSSTLEGAYLMTLDYEYYFAQASLISLGLRIVVLVMASSIQP